MHCWTITSRDEPSRTPAGDWAAIKAAVAAATQAGGELAHPPLEIPGYGTFATYLQGGIDHGLWQR